MVKGSAVVSLAILKVNWDVYQKDYLENFVPLLAEAVRLSDEEIVSVPELQKDVEVRFGLKIPQNVLSTLLRRLQKRGFIALENRVYIRNNDILRGLNFGKVQQEVLQQHHRLVDNLRGYAKEKFSVGWLFEEAEEAILTYLKENEIISLDLSKCGIPNQTTQPVKYIVATFIQHAVETYTPDAQYIDTVIKGNMLASAIYRHDPGKAMMNFKNTKVFLDTPILMNALGYAGAPRKEAALELLNLLRETGADLRCFTKTVEEVRGILYACADRLGKAKQRDSNGLFWETVDNFVLAGQTPSDIEQLIPNVESNLAKLGILTADTPDYKEFQHNIDVKGLTEALKEKITYRNPEALSHDVDCISAIMRLRSGRQHYNIEECRAIFVTLNASLYFVSCGFLKQIGSGYVPACILDNQLTCLLWLKKPMEAPELPIKRIIADCYAAIQPDERLWKAYLNKVEELKTTGQVTADEYYSLLYSLEAKTVLMDITLGQEKAFDQGTVPEILSRLRLEKEAEIQRRIHDEKEAADAAIADARAQVAAFLSKELEKELKLTKRSEDISAWVCRPLKWLFLAALLTGMYFTLPGQMPDNLSGISLFHAYVVPALFTLFFIMTGMNMMFGTTVQNVFIRLEARVSIILKERLTHWFG